MLTYKLWFQYEKPAEDQAPDRTVEIEEDEAQYWDNRDIIGQHGFEGMHDDDGLRAVWILSPEGEWDSRMLRTRYEVEYFVDELTQYELDSYREYAATLPSGTPGKVASQRYNNG